MKSHIKQLQSILKKNDIGGMVVSNPSNIFYLTGFRGVSPSEREVAVFITPSHCYLFSPRMYAEQAKHMAFPGVMVVVDTKHDGVLHMFADYVSQNSVLLFEETDLRVAEFEEMRAKTDADWNGAGELMSSLRVIKDAEELLHIKKAAEITDSVFNEIITYLSNTNYQTLTELDIVDVMRAAYRKLGGESFGFDPIIACGKGSAEPHYHTSNRKLKKNEALLMDFGITYKGYTADLTRTVFLGTAPDNFRAHYDIVLKCNKHSLQAAKSGVSAGDLHANAVSFFQKLNLADNFIHSLGHGVGIDIHEEPFFRINTKEPLAEGMVVTIEPGLYFTGEYGIRIEDLIAVGENGSEVYSCNSSKELIEIR